jgi:ribosome assembly protein 4
LLTFLFCSVLYNECKQGRQLASGSGDTTVRLWDLNTQLPLTTGQGGHSNWVLVVSWAPDGKHLVSGGMDNLVCLWDPKTAALVGTLKG